MTQHILHEVLPHFSLKAVRRITPIPLSLINRNYLIETEKGNFIIQRMAKIFTKDTVEDMAKVTTYLAQQGIPTLVLIQTNDGEWCYEDTEEYLWKLMVAVPGETIHVVSHPRLAYEAGQLLGEFQKGLRQFDPSTLKNPLRLHQTEKIYTDFSSIYDQLVTQEQDASHKEAYEYIFSEFPKVILPEELPRSVVHGDPKISNFIFQDGKGVCMIDLDTSMYHTPLVDVGDALRSWCGKEEDHPENSFSLDIFEQAMKGYLSVMPLSQKEIAHVYDATRMITLELASRFAKDIVDDYYFGWDELRYSSRKEHNRVRAYSMVKLAQDIEKKKHDIQSILFNTERCNA